MEVDKTVGGTCHSKPNAHQFHITTFLLSSAYFQLKKYYKKVKINSHPAVRQQEVNIAAEEIIMSSQHFLKFIFIDSYLVMTVIAGLM